jgi:hypothetical protein
MPSQTRQRTIEHSIHVAAPAETIWRHITEVDLDSFDHPVYLRWLDIPKPVRAEVTAGGVGGARTAFFDNGARFTQVITVWQPPTQYAFTFHPDPGFRVAHLLDLSNGPFQMKSGAYRLVPAQGGTTLTLTSDYELHGLLGILLNLPVRIVLHLFQKYLLHGIKANAECEGE